MQFSSEVALVMMWSSRNWNSSQCWEKVTPFPLGPQCHRSTTQLWPQLLFKWQTVWQSQVVEIYHWGPPQTSGTRPPPRRGRKAPDKPFFVLGRVLPILSTPQHSAFTSAVGLLCLQLTVPLHRYYVFRSHECWVTLIKLYFKQVSHCKKFDFLKLLVAPIHQSLWFKVEKSTFPSP